MYNTYIGLYIHTRITFDISQRSVHIYDDLIFRRYSVGIGKLLVKFSKHSISSAYE